MFRVPYLLWEGVSHPTSYGRDYTCFLQVSLTLLWLHAR